MVMAVMMTAHGIRRNSQTTQDSQGDYDEKHSTDIHDDSPSIQTIQPFSFPNGLTSPMQLISSNPCLRLNVFLITAMFHP